MNDNCVFLIASEAEMQAFGARLSAELPEQMVVSLNGPLGAGKTRLVQAVAAAAEVPAGVVSSPTFVIVHEYTGRVPIFHFDAYRLRDEDEFAALGPEEYFARRGWCFLEWADRVAGCLPAEHLRIDIEPTGETTRRVTLTARGEAAQNVLAQLSAITQANTSPGVATPGLRADLS